MSKSHPLTLYRADHDVTQVELARLARISQGYLASIEAYRRSPSFRVAERLSLATGGLVTELQIMRAAKEKPSNEPGSHAEDF